MSSPNGQRHDLKTPRSYVVELFAKLTGAGAADLVNADSAVNGGGEIASAVHGITGTYVVTFRKLWPQLLYAPTFSFVDATSANIAGLEGTCTAIDVTAGTATFVFSQNSTTLVDVPSTTTVYVRWTVRASSKN